MLKFKEVETRRLNVNWNHVGGTIAAGAGTAVLAGAIGLAVT